MKSINEMELSFLAVSENEAFARVAASAFCVPLSPSLAEINDIKTAISEAVTNVVVHAYPGTKGWVSLKVQLFEGGTAVFTIEDGGVGIEDFESAKKPFFTSCPGEERSGMGFSVMETFMDELVLTSGKNGSGLKVVMTKKFEKTEINSYAG